MESSMTQQYGQPRGPQAPTSYGQPQNGLGLAAIICAIVALPCALIPSTFIIGAPLSIVAIALGIAAQTRVRRGRATNGKVTVFAIIFGAVALFGAINEARVLISAVNTYNDQMQQLVDDELREHPQ
jgi:tellurite resistance protein TehA-like permease